MTHFLRGWNVSQHTAMILDLVKYCTAAKGEKSGFCPGRTQTPALTQCSWTTEGSPSDRKAKWFVSLWLVSSNNHVFYTSSTLLIKNHSALSSNKSLILIPVTKAFPQELVQSSWPTSFTTESFLGLEEARSTLTWPPVVHRPCSAPHCYFRKPLRVKAGMDLYMGWALTDQGVALEPINVFYT